MEGISIYELQRLIKGCIDSSFTQHYWVKGEISAIKSNYSGHCYMDLVDSSENSKGIIAKVSAIVWSSSWRVIKPYFEHTTGRSLEVGMNILVKVVVQYSELYGLSLIISEIDPTFSVGEAEILRRQIVERLSSEGMIGMNKMNEIAMLPRRFAIISSETAAGYRDFVKHLHENEYGFSFHTKLFPAPMQGAAAPSGIVSALDAIYAELEEGIGSYDAVLIIRGGGSNIDLSCFDDYEMAAGIAQFPLPVFTAVGHEQDFHICDMVAFDYLKTPTALADFFLDIFAQEDGRLSSLASKLSFSVSNKIHIEESRLNLLEQRAVRGNPLAVIDNGFCLIEKKGEKINTISSLCIGDNLMIRMKGGIAVCTVNELLKNE